ncbi:MAG: hypothetical protein K2H35_05535 [Muribaculaceae bacterium]|nr:hypothetical protein [Muribaculaceae bacterium]MDE6559037.1 hypothetical protein [Muribaculaceae bacterium]
MNRRVLYPAGMIWIILICLALAALGAGLDFTFPGTITRLYARPVDFGIAFPSPNVWNFLPGWGEAINIIALGVCALSFYLLNKQFGLTRTGQPIGAAFLLPLTYANFAISSHLTAAPLVMMFCIMIFAALLNSYRKRNATHAMFFVATCLSVGSMMEYAMIPFILASLLGAFFLGAMRIKEFLALGIGLIAPYWVAIGLGIVNPLEMHLPHPQTIFSTIPDMPTFLLLALVTILTLGGIFLSLYNGLILYAGNTRVHRSVLTINAFGIIAMLSMWLDLNNIEAYLGVFYLWIALQLANLFTLRELQRSVLTFWFLQLAIMSTSLLFILHRF